MITYDDIPKFIRSPGYAVNVAWLYLEDWLRDTQDSVGLDLDPDFQRAHVWTAKQKSRYIEFVLKGGTGSRHIYWNSVNFNQTHKIEPFQLVDGKQRLTAVREFLANKVKAFGHLYKNFDRSCFRIGHADFVMCVNNLPTRCEVLRWYLDINAGGVVHTEEELDKVRALLLEQEKQ